MGMSQKNVGGGAAAGFAPEFIDWLQGGLQTGTFGGGSSAGNATMANPMGATMGISSVLNDILSGGAGQLGGSMMDMISKDTDRQANALRARFGASGGQAFGTPAAYAESMLRSEQAPKMTQAIGQLQLQALAPLLQMMMGVTGMGTPQAETVMQQNPWVQGIGMGTDLLGAIAGIARTAQGK